MVFSNLYVKIYGKIWSVDVFLVIEKLNDQGFFSASTEATHA